MPNKKLAALYCVYDDYVWLPYSVSSIYEVVDIVFFFVNTRPWFYDEKISATMSNDKTLAVIGALPDPKKKFQLIEHTWSSEAEERNYSLAVAQLAKCDYGLIIDADEIYDTEELGSLCNYAANNPEIDCWHVVWHTYWKSLGYRIEPVENYQPPVLVKIGSGGFVETRNFRANRHELLPPSIGCCHHMSYARTDEQIMKKITSFSHAPQIGADWFKNVWKKWDDKQDLTNLHPVLPTQYQCAVKVPATSLPRVLHELAQQFPDFPQI